MIDFRYHLVSIVAVFLALAIGIVLGSTELQGKTFDALRETSNSLSSQLNAARDQRDGYLAQVAADQQFAQANETELLARLLPGQSLVLVTEPGADNGVITGIEKAAHVAGATITGTIALQSKFNDTTGATEASLNGLDGNLAQRLNTTLLPGSDQQTVNQQQAAQLLASAVTTKSASSPTGLSVASAQTVLNTYAEAGFISVSGQPQFSATLAVIVTPQAPPSDGSSDPANLVLTGVAQEFASYSAATAVAGNASGDGSDSAMSVLRSSSVSGQVSTVDNADTTMGQITGIQALARQLQGGKAAAYGVQSGATSAGPSPAPTPGASVTESASPTSTTKAKGKKK